MMQGNIQFRNEAHAEKTVAVLMEEKWKCMCKRQVPINGKIPDIIGYNKRSDTTFAIEIKLKNWKKGICQAFLNKNLVDYSFLCMPIKPYSGLKNRIQKNLELTGLGFIVVDPMREDILMKKIPQKNNINKIRKENLKQLIFEDGEKENEYLF